MSNSTERITTDDALFVIQKSGRDEVLEVAEIEENNGFEYASIDEAKAISQKAVDLFKPTLDELKHR